jgi:hypothetical protein
MKKSTSSEDRIYGVLKQDGPMTPAEVKSKTGLSRETIWRGIRNLLTSDKVRQVSQATYLGARRGMAGATYEAIELDYGYSALAAVMHAWRVE